MQIKSFFQTMKDGAELWVNRWIPDSEENTPLKGLVILNHGLAEHAMRYDRLGSVLAENGYILTAFDMRGHGHTADNAIEKGSGDYGIIAVSDGEKKIVSDLEEIILKAKQDFPGLKTFLIGHSFGSFVSQAFIEAHSEMIDGCILMGTSGPNPALNFGAKASSLICLLRGKFREAKLLKFLSFGAYNKRIKKPETDYDWLSKDKSNVQIYHMDKWCGIPLTNSFFYDMIRLMKNMLKLENVNKIRKDLPVLMLYGSDDPVGNYGKSVIKLCKIYAICGIKDVRSKEYPQMRHELLNDIDKEKTETDIIYWLNEQYTLTQTPVSHNI